MGWKQWSWWPEGWDHTSLAKEGETLFKSLFPSVLLRGSERVHAQIFCVLQQSFCVQTDEIIVDIVYKAAAPWIKVSRIHRLCLNRWSWELSCVRLIKVKTSSGYLVRHTCPAWAFWTRITWDARSEHGDQIWRTAQHPFWSREEPGGETLLEKSARSILSPQVHARRLPTGFFSLRKEVQRGGWATEAAAMHSLLSSVFWYARTVDAWHGWWPHIRWGVKTCGLYMIYYLSGGSGW